MRKEKTEQAIQLALNNRWDEAVAVNQAIVELFPNDVDAYNRLGKALAELGRYVRAREAYAVALGLDHGNTIARKNLERLAAMVKKAKEVRRPEMGPKVSPNLFIGEVGKSGTTILINTAPEVLTRAAVGDEVFLRRRNSTLVVENATGEYLGEVEPKLGLRLLKLMDGGNRYAVAIVGLSENRVRVVIKETYQDPSQAGKLSFLPTGVEDFRPYIKESMLKHEATDELIVDDEEAEAWEGGTRSKEVDEHLYEDQTTITADEEEAAEGDEDET